MFKSLEGEESRRGVKGRRVVETRVEKNGYPLPYLDIFKIKGNGRVEGNIVCNFVNMVRINWVIHLVKHFYVILFLQISPIWKN